MSYGLKSYDDDGYINLHSDYSSLVYAGEMSESASPVRPVYAGSNAISIQDYETIITTKGGYYSLLST